MDAAYFLSLYHICDQRIVGADYLMEPILIEGHVLDFFAGNSRFFCGADHCRRYNRQQPAVERFRQNIVFAERQPVNTVSLDDVFGHRLLRECGDGSGGGDFHRLVDFRGPTVQCATENIWEAEHIVYLVGIVTATCGKDKIGTRLDC